MELIKGKKYRCKRNAVSLFEEGEIVEFVCSHNGRNTFIGNQSGVDSLDDQLVDSLLEPIEDEPEQPKRKKYHYFFSYRWVNGDDDGFGRCNVSLYQNHEDRSFFQDMEKEIIKHHNFESAVILNFKLLKEEEID